jgi:hypothetical protein
MPLATTAGAVDRKSDRFVDRLERVCTTMALALMSTREREMLETVLARKAAGEAAPWQPIYTNLGFRGLS